VHDLEGAPPDWIGLARYLLVSMLIASTDSSGDAHQQLE
jgi:hypothetical protein